MSRSLRFLGVPFTALAVAGTVSFAAVDARAADPDPWFGPDKTVHFAFSAGLAAGGYGVSSFLLEKPWQRTVAGASFSLTLGAGKELYDLTGHGDPSWKDFTWDVVGTAVGVGIALLVDTAISSSSGSRTAVRGSRFAITF